MQVSSLFWVILLIAAVPDSFLSHRGGYQRQKYTERSSNTSDLHIHSQCFKPERKKTEYMDYSLSFNA